MHSTLEQTPRPLKIVYAEVAATDTDARGGEPVLVLEPLPDGYTPYSPTLANLPLAGQP